MHHLGVEADAGHEEKETAAGAAESDLPRRAAQGSSAGAFEVEGDACLEGEDVGRSQGDESQRRLAGRQSVDNLVEGAVAPGGDDAVETLLAGPGRLPFGIAGGLRQKEVDIGAISFQEPLDMVDFP